MVDDVGRPLHEAAVQQLASGRGHGPPTLPGLTPNEIWPFTCSARRATELAAGSPLDQERTRDFPRLFQKLFEPFFGNVLRSGLALTEVCKIPEKRQGRGTLIDLSHVVVRQESEPPISPLIHSPRSESSPASIRPPADAGH